jgi:hypothetical protein
VLAIVGLAMALVVAVAMGTFFKRRGKGKILTAMVEVAASSSDSTDAVKRRGTGKILTAMVEAAASSSDSTDAVAQETSAQGHAVVGKNTPLARFLELAGRLGVKSRILISLAQVSPGPARCARTAAERGRHHLLSGRACSQVLSQVTTTYQIDFPDLYSEMLSTFESINIPIKFLPFGCTFPNLDNYMFDLVLQTATPLRAPPNPDLQFSMLACGRERASNAAICTAYNPQLDRPCS